MLLEAMLLLTVLTYAAFRTRERSDLQARRVRVRIRDQEDRNGREGPEDP